MNNQNTGVDRIPVPVYQPESMIRTDESKIRIDLNLHSLKQVEELISTGNVSSGLETLRLIMEMASTDTRQTRHILPENNENRMENSNLSKNYQLRIYTMGRFSIIKDDEKLVFKRRAQEKPIELVKLLLSLGGREISKEHVAELLWPDACGDRASRALATTLHRTRKLLGKDSIVLQSGCLTLNRDYCWVDVWQFEKLLNQVKTIHNNKSIDIGALKDALDLYHGHFMVEDSYGWAMPRREKLRQKLYQVLSAACGFLSREDRSIEAIELYLKVLEADELAEEIYLGLMQCYINLENWIDAASAYNRYESILKRTNGSQPGPVIKRQYEELIRISPVKIV